MIGYEAVWYIFALSATVIRSRFAFPYSAFCQMKIMSRVTIKAMIVYRHQHLMRAHFAIRPFTSRTNVWRTPRSTGVMASIAAFAMVFNRTRFLGLTNCALIASTSSLALIFVAVSIGIDIMSSVACRTMVVMSHQMLCRTFSASRASSCLTNPTSTVPRICI